MRLLQTASIQDNTRLMGGDSCRMQPDNVTLYVIIRCMDDRVLEWSSSKLLFIIMRIIIQNFHVLLHCLTAPWVSHPESDACSNACSIAL